MTGYTVHTGTTIQFSEGWDRIFPKPATKSSTAKTKKASAKKSVGGRTAKARVKRAAKGKR